MPQEFIPLTFSPQVKKQTVQHTVQISPVQIHAIFLKYINQPDGIVINICAVSCHGVKLLVHLWGKSRERQLHKRHVEIQLALYFIYYFL